MRLQHQLRHCYSLGYSANVIPCADATADQGTRDSWVLDGHSCCLFILHHCETSNTQLTDINQIFCAIISKYFTFRDIYDDSYQFWYLREASVGIYVTNAPFIWTLVQSMMGYLRATAHPTNSEYNNKHQWATTGMSNTHGKGGTETRSTCRLTGTHDTNMIAPSSDDIIEMDDEGRRTYPGAGLMSGSELTDLESPRSGSSKGESKFWKTTENAIEKE